MKNLEEKKLALADNLLTHSLKLKAGDNLYIESRGAGQKPYAELVEQLAKQRGLNVRSKYMTIEEHDDFWAQATEEEAKKLTADDIAEFKWADGILLFRQPIQKTLNEKQQKLYNQYVKEAHIDVRVKKKWCLTLVPEKEKDLEMYLSSCALDYDKMEKEMDALVHAMLKTDKVRILAPGTDITLRIKGQNPVKCVGTLNMPDGEVFVGPIKDSINGVIKYNVPGNYHGFTFEDVELKVKDGKIMDINCNNKDYLTQILDSDEGARYFGEFSFGLNPMITKPVGDILFDEKIAGSIHLTPGGCYDESYNGNESGVHFDLVQSHRPEAGGGEIYFDDVLVRKDGEFVLDNLKGLNPENLMHR